MLSSFLLSFREGLEAALVIGIVLGVLLKINRPELRRVVGYGAAVAILVSLFAALILQGLGAEFEGRAEEIYEGVAMLSAAILLTWMIFWMKRQAGSLQHELERDVKKAASQGSTRALFALVFLAVGREGLELGLFLTASTFASNAFQTIIGAALGLAVSAALGYLLFATTRRLSLRQFFQVTNILLILFAAGLAAHGIHGFNEAGLVPAGIEHVWDLNPVINEGSVLGQVLASLFGYRASPSLAEAGAYLGYFVLLWLLFKKNRLTQR
jgi:high-affinity iron transporter